MLLKVILITGVLTLLAVAAMSIRLFFHKDSRLQATCNPKYASNTGDGDCGCGGCGCGGGKP
jgi:hypothetical protein